MLTFRKSLLSVAALAAFAAPALAADLYVPEIPIEPVLPSWTDCYVGVGITYTTGNPSSEAPFSNYATDVSGPGVSPRVGCDIQLPDSPVVVGIVVDGTAQIVTGTREVVPGAFAQTLTTTIPWEFSLRARAGVAADQTLFYLTGGLAVAAIHNSLAIVGGAGAESSATHIGWTAGGGIEHMVTDNISIFAEYRYTDYGTQNHTFPGANFGGGVPPLETIPFGATSHRIAVGANYRF